MERQASEPGRGEQVLIVGAGAAGMAVAAKLRARRIDPLLLEREQALGMSWARRYDSLRLNTPRLTSGLPGYRMPRRYGRWPKRDDLVQYLGEYARRLRLRVRAGVEATRIDPVDHGWLVRANEGDFAARCVVVATGHDRHPFIPEWPGREGFTGRLIHSSDYREPSPFRGLDVLVVSARNSGTEISLELARGGAARVRTSMRTPPHVFPREWLGWPLNYSAVTLEPFADRVGDVAGGLTQRMIYGDLSRWGIGRPPLGVQTTTRRLHRSVLVDGGYVEALKRGEVEIVAAVQAFEGAEVVLSDRSRARPDAVIAATGFQSGLDQLVGHLGLLGKDGYPLARRTDLPHAPGLFFNGYYASMAGQLVHMGPDGRHIARAIARRL